MKHRYFSYRVWVQNAIFILSVFVFMGTKNLQAQFKNSNIEAAKHEFNKAKFGMFIHWGVYSKLGGIYKDSSYNGTEWIMLKANISNNDYEKIARTFNPVSFDPDKWMDLAQRAGMKYIVFTTKHHDGFCMFDSKYTDYDIVDFTPYKRDIVKMLADACKKRDIKLGLYYSIVDWHHPHFPAAYSNNGKFHGNPNPNADMGIYANYEYNQLKELMSNYGPVHFVWFDAGGGFKNADRFKLNKGDSVVSMIRKLQPQCLINSRIGAAADYGNPEQSIPGKIQEQAFEVCMTINDNWGFAKKDQHWKSSRDLIRKLIEVAHKGGNYLLNVGPDGDGNIPEPSIKRLEDMGNWLKINGESIYGTYNSLWESPSWGFSTTRFLDNKNSILYFQITNWPVDNKLKVPGMKNKVNKAFILNKNGKESIKFNQSEKDIIINLPAEMPDPIATVVGIEVEGQKFQMTENPLKQLQKNNDDKGIKSQKDLE